MKKFLWKKILNILDEIETRNIKGALLNEAVSKVLTEHNISFERQALEAFITYLYRYGFIKETKSGMDLSPVATILARSESYSRLEALAVFECFYRFAPTRKVWKEAVHQKCSINSLLPGPDLLMMNLLGQTSLVFDQKNQYWITDRYTCDLDQIMNEVDDDDNSLISVTLCSFYTDSIIDHKSGNVLYKNQDHTIVPYHYLPTILTVIPRHGIPCERSETKTLQAFYKDTLFHEFNHRCPICGIDLPHMLIASHIKPFRECAHIYEAIDHHNGLLLCRNHDYLFDQGYISFSACGSLMISKELCEKEDLTPYHLNPDFTLPQQFISVSRQLFFSYHRRHIYKG